MRNRRFLFASALVVVALFVVGCSGTNASPNPEGGFRGAPTSPPVSNQSTSANTASKPTASTSAGSNSSTSFEAKTVDGGSVTVKVMPLAVKSGAPLEFDIAMDTHSVDLSNDMLKAVVLRDEAGKEYAPTAWEGSTGGGHHREGKIKFSSLTATTKSVTLVVKGIAGVPERVFKWDLPQ